MFLLPYRTWDKQNKTKNNNKEKPKQNKAEQGKAKQKKLTKTISLKIYILK